MTAARRRIRSLVVQQSFPEPRDTTNPYIVMLRESLAATSGVSVRTFSYRNALIRRYDVFHAHWPENLLTARTPLRRAVRHLLFVLLMAKLLLASTPIVRTVHNIRPPHGISRREQALLRWFDRRTALRIVLNSRTDAAAPAVLVTHGDYREWFAQYTRPPAEPGHIAFVGLVRRYKGVEQLMSAFSQTRDPTLTLYVGGRPSSSDLAVGITTLAERDERVVTRLVFHSDADLVLELARSQLVVLPYRKMHNSGAVLAALSVGRAVLVPDTPVTRDLAAEVGESWVQLFRGDLTARDLTEALALSSRILLEGSAPDLSSRGWAGVGRQHLDAYRQAVDITRHPRRTQ